MSLRNLIPPYFTLIAFLGTIALANEARLWTSSGNGRQFKGELIEVHEDSISIRRAADGVTFKVTFDTLVPEDIEWAKAMAAGKPIAAAAAPIKIEDLSELITKIPAETGAPAVGVLLVKEGVLFGTGVAGVRKAGATDHVELNDKWHLGSCTKSMTATLAATFVEDGSLKWDSTVGEILGKDVKMLEAYESVTLGTLLANRSGLPKTVENAVYSGIETTALPIDLKSRDLLKQRLLFVEAVLNIPPAVKPGTGYGYSNSGFVVAGAMLEKVSGTPWEELIEERIFKPLGMNDSGFGNAAREDKDQPWPHKTGNVPVDPGPGDENPWVIGPAATAHGSLKDIARYITMHASRELGPVIKKAETYEYLHTAVPENSNYARGWIVASSPWSNGPAVSHDGSNTLNYCSIWVASRAKAAVAAFTNTADKGSDVCMKAINAVVAKHLP